MQRIMLKWTGAVCTVKEFINKCCNYLSINIYWSGKALKEHAYIIRNNKKIILIKVDSNYFRPLEVDFLRGNPRKAFNKLNFKPKYTLDNLIQEMLESDLLIAKKEADPIS